MPTAGGKDSLVIYSYGDGNTYYHPIMDGHYTSHGWLREHHTAISGDYEETIQLDLQKAGTGLCSNRNIPRFAYKK